MRWISGHPEYAGLRGNHVEISVGDFPHFPKASITTRVDHGPTVLIITCSIKLITIYNRQKPTLLSTGIRGGRHCIYTSSPIDAKELFLVLDDRRKKSAPSVPDSDAAPARDKPAIDIDASQVAYRFRRSSGGSAGFIVRLAVALARCGIDVTIVGDPPHRHHSKRATIDRIAKCERARLHCITHQAELARAIQLHDMNDDQCFASRESSGFISFLSYFRIKMFVSFV